MPVSQGALPPLAGWAFVNMDTVQKYSVDTTVYRLLSLS